MTPEEFQDILDHLERWTGDPAAWTRGLHPSEVLMAPGISNDPQRLETLAAKIRAAHPGLFDTRTGAPVAPKKVPHSPLDPKNELPPASPESQRGAAAEAIKSAEAALAHQNSACAHLDLLVVTAILTAHATTAAGTDKLAALQREIEQAVRTRTDLDTPAGARDFQRFLIGKLRQIAEVVESAALDDNSEAALAGARAALYAASKAAPTADPGSEDPNPRPPKSDGAQPKPEPASEAATDVGSTNPASAPSGSAPVQSGQPASLPYDTGLLPYDALGDLGADPLAGSGTPPAATTPASAVMPTTPSIPLSSSPSGSQGSPATLPSLSSSAPGTGSDLLKPSSYPSTDPLAGLDLDELLAEEQALTEPDLELTEPSVDLDEPEPVTADQGAEHQHDPESPSTSVELPDGETVTARTPQLAGAVRQVLAGTPVAEAFHQQGITLPAPGTAVEHPVAADRLGAGDIGMFVDRIAVALGPQRAVLDGQIQPVTSVSGPSFLGWQHPPEPVAVAPTGPAAPADGPTQTRPAAYGYAR